MASQSVEDYLEAIYRLAGKKDSVRIVDISESLQIKPPSVLEMLQKLEAKRFITYEKHRGVKLTQKGKELAKKVEQRHNVLTDFLSLLDIRREIAEEDACRIEHVINPTTAEKLIKFVSFVNSSPKKPEWLKHYKHYCKTSRHFGDEDG